MSPETAALILRGILMVEELIRAGRMTDEEVQEAFKDMQSDWQKALDAEWD
jgi:threonine dehydrogenase-like Zn-dependent dehydrogenase